MVERENPDISVEELADLMERGRDIMARAEQSMAEMEELRRLMTQVLGDETLTDSEKIARLKEELV